MKAEWKQKTKWVHVVWIVNQYVDGDMKAWRQIVYKLFFVLYTNVRDLCAALDTGFDNSSLSPNPGVYVA